jgi:hypothetical protein
MKFKKMNQCPRCKLPQGGIYKCQYCGYDVSIYNKKSTKIIRKKLSNIIGRFIEKQIAIRPKRSKALSLNTVRKVFKRAESGERRSRTDRRKLKYTTYYPERRSGLDRRK